MRSLFIYLSFIFILCNSFQYIANARDYASCVSGDLENFGYTDNVLLGKIENMSDTTAGDKELGIQIIIDDGIYCSALAAKDIDSCKGKHSGITYNKICGRKVVWAQKPEYSEYTGKAKIQICASQCFACIYEACHTISSGETKNGKDLGIDYNSKISAELDFFSLDNTGSQDRGDDDDRYGHRVGYVFNLYSGECPYGDQDDKVSCLLMGSYQTVKKEYYKGMSYSFANNCYEAIKEDMLACENIGKVSECMCIDDSDTGDCKASTKYIPKQDSEYWSSLDSKMQSCFLCYSAPRIKLDNCLKASFDKGHGFGPKNKTSDKIKELITSMKTSTTDDKIEKLIKFKAMYGVGTYVCGYADSNTLTTDNKRRAGCARVLTKSPPRPFPRIARAWDQSFQGSNLFFLYFPAANIFEVTSYVRQFNDNTISGICSGNQEIGETVRGDFYNPSLIVRYGYSEKQIWFEPPNTSEFLAKYNTKDSTITNDQVRSTQVSDWSTKDPAIIKYGKRDDSISFCHVYTTDDVTAERICTRIEYDVDEDSEFFVAYRVKQTAPNKSCNKHSSDGDLEKIGGVPRPPLKYKYNTEGKFIQTPIVMSNPIAAPSQLQAVVYIDPMVNVYFISSTGTKQIFSKTDDVSKPNAAASAVQSKRLTLVMANPTIAVSDGSVQTLPTSNDDGHCGWILNHKICVGPFLGTNCSLLDVNNKKGIRDTITLGIINSGNASIDCPYDSDGVHKNKCYNEIVYYDAMYPQCLAMKRCSSGLTDDACSNSGSMHIKVPEGQAQEMQFNYEWSDGVCIINGIDSPTFATEGEIGDIVRFGPYDNITNATDSVITFKTGVVSQKIPARTDGSVVKTGALDLVEVPNEYFTEPVFEDKIQKLINIMDTNQANLTSRYLGNGCNTLTCISGRLDVRRKNMDELNLCRKFDRLDSIEYGHGMENNGYGAGSKYNFYIPHKCDFIEAQVLGPGGKSEQWNDNARSRNKFYYGMYGSVYELAMSWYMQLPGPACQGCGLDSDKYKNTKRARDDAMGGSGADDRGKHLTSGGGGGGGYVHGIVQLKKMDRDVLLIKPGNDVAENKKYCCPTHLDEGCNANSDLAWINIDSADITNSPASYITNKYDVIPTSAILYAKGGSQKQMDDQSTIGGGGGYNASYIQPDGYSKGLCSTFILAKFNKEVPVKPMLSKKDCNSGAGTPTYDRLEDLCFTGSGTKCCNHSDEDEDICREYVDVNNGGNCRDASYTVQTPKDYSIFQAFLDNCPNNQCCDKTNEDTKKNTACLESTTTKGTQCIANDPATYAKYTEMINNCANNPCCNNADEQTRKDTACIFEETKSNVDVACTPDKYPDLQAAFDGCGSGNYTCCDPNNKEATACQEQLYTVDGTFDDDAKTGLDIIFYHKTLGNNICSTVPWHHSINNAILNNVSCATKESRNIPGKSVSGTRKLLNNSYNCAMLAYADKSYCTSCNAFTTNYTTCLKCGCKYDSICEYTDFKKNGCATPTSFYAGNIYQKCQYQKDNFYGNKCKGTAKVCTTPGAVENGNDYQKCQWQKENKYNKCTDQEVDVQSCATPASNENGTNNEKCEWQRLNAYGQTTTTTVTKYCCLNQTCMQEIANKNKGKIKSYGRSYSDSHKYGKALKEWQDSWDNYNNFKKFALFYTEGYFKEMYEMMCPIVVYGENGADGTVKNSDKHLRNGGGNRAIKVINGIEKQCPVHSSTLNMNGNDIKTFDNIYDDSCTKHKMTEEYCETNCSSAECQAFKWFEDKTNIITKHQFRGSGGCSRDHRKWNDKDEIFSNDDEIVNKDNDMGSDKEANGGDGWIKLTIPYIKYDITGVKAEIATTNGISSKILNSDQGLRDMDCVPRCPRAYIQVGDYICEYSSGDPTNAYETPLNENRIPIKCIDKDGKIHIHTDNVNRVCLFTKCPDQKFSTTYRYFGLCDMTDSSGKVMSIYDNDRIFYSSAAFYTDLANSADATKFCGSSDAVLGTDYFTNDELSKIDYTMTCDDHGNWRSAKDAKYPKYKCPQIMPSFYKFYQTAFFPQSYPYALDEYSTFVSPIQDRYCGGYGLIKPL